MATTDPIADITSPPERSGNGLLVLLAPMAAEQLEAVLSNLSVSFPPQSLLVAAPEALPAENWPALQMIAAPAVKSAMTLTAADFVNANQLAEQHDARAVLMMGPEAGSLSADAVRKLANAVLSTAADLAIPCYDLPPNTGLVNSAILYPLSRALFACSARFPLAIDLGLSRRMAERLAQAAQRYAALNQGESLLWPLNEAALAGFTVAEFNVGPRTFPQPTDPDVNAILVHVTGSLFSDIDAKAAFWQRARRPVAARNSRVQPMAAESLADILPMLEAFRLAYSNLQEIWSLVLPPNSLLGLKRLSQASPATFRMPESLWARIVYDFLLAFRLRTLNRGHLMGALIPLYLAWVASHINVMASGADPEHHIEAAAAAFETEKPYVVSRWRWPDRFNP
jgi:glucosylglycerate synthase